MRVAIVEDEAPARVRLASAIRAASSESAIVAMLGGVAETVAWLQSNGMPDLLFLDIQLSDGLSFEILERCQVTCPVIFATAFDEYLIDAFQSNGIDYLLKPISERRVSAALAKYRALREHFTSHPSPAGAPAIARGLGRPDTGFRQRFLVRKGLDLLTVPISGAAYFYTAEKLVFLVTKAGARFMLDRPLAELEAELDPVRFFRANRSFLVGIDAVTRCRPYGKGKLLLDLSPPAPEEAIVSQERAGAFRRWLGGEPAERP